MPAGLPAPTTSQPVVVAATVPSGRSQPLVQVAQHHHPAERRRQRGDQQAVVAPRHQAPATVPGRVAAQPVRDQPFAVAELDRRRRVAHGQGTCDASMRRSSRRRAEDDGRVTPAGASASAGFELRACRRRRSADGSLDQTRLQPRPSGGASKGSAIVGADQVAAQVDAAGAGRRGSTSSPKNRSTNASGPSTAPSTPPPPCSGTPGPPAAAAADRCAARRRRAWRSRSPRSSLAALEREAVGRVGQRRLGLGSRRCSETARGTPPGPARTTVASSAV